MKKWLANLFVIPLIAFQLCSVCYAAEEDGQQKDTSVLQMVVLYEDADGNQHPVQGGSGFLIDDEEAGAEYIITSKEVTSVSEKTTQQIMENFREEEKIQKSSYIVKAVVKRDIMIDAQLVAESDEMGFAVWKLAQPLYDREALVLYDDTLTGISGQKVTALGFPTAPGMTGETIYYAQDELITEEGSLIGDSREDGVKYVYHNILPESGMLGGPILNEKGHVVALNQNKEAQEGYYALQISELLPVLDALGISYVTTSEVGESDITMGGFGENLSLGLILVIILSVLVVIAVVLAIVWVMTNPDRKEKKQKNKNDKMQASQNLKQLGMEVQSETINAQDIYGETVVFSQEVNDTIVLCQEDKRKQAYLIRKHTNQKIDITEREFVIGKDPSQTDYCLTGNSAISRTHAVIRSEGSDYAVCDMNATNGTFVNGTKVEEFQKITLTDGDIIRLADEDFEFRIAS